MRRKPTPHYRNTGGSGIACAAFLAGFLLLLTTGCAGDGAVGETDRADANADRPEGVRLSIRFPDDTEVRIRGVDEMHNTLPVDGTTLPWVSYEVVEITKLISQARKHLRGDADIVEVSGQDGTDAGCRPTIARKDAAVCHGRSG